MYPAAFAAKTEQKPRPCLSEFGLCSRAVVAGSLFRSAYELYMLRGQTRANLSADFVAHVARFAQRAESADRSSLAASRVPHPFDVSPTLAEQVTSVQPIDADALIRDTLAALSEPKTPDNALPAIEARITSLENDYFRVPGRRVALD